MHRSAIALITLPLLALGACQSTGMSAMAPAVSALSFVSVQGPESATAKKFEGVLAEEARRRGYGIGSGMQVKTFLDAYPTPDGKTGYSWVLDASPDGKVRAARARGTAMLGTGAGWTGFDEAAMRQVARMGLDDLTRQMAGSAPASEAAAAE